MGECLHLQTSYTGRQHCDLLIGKADCKTCKFYCDSDRFFYSHTEYQGARCCYIKEKKGAENHEYRAH